ncbi:hypothetical protein DSY3945 [Desulfitobacterium hafniense Y51]|uniref:Uncharacterized protein n=1 Tax=Desulfitobacterium hafniense (strain Y51) TaxID=138119 RepID=Q24QF8_DESHY|nr:hypothetical protein DSY3945 [Desulfitobacterium hafniense Y51]
MSKWLAKIYLTRIICTTWGDFTTYAPLTIYTYFCKTSNINIKCFNYSVFPAVITRSLSHKSSIRVSPSYLGSLCPWNILYTSCIKHPPTVEEPPPNAINVTITLFYFSPNPVDIAITFFCVFPSTNIWVHCHILTTLLIDKPQIAIATT